MVGDTRSPTASMRTLKYFLADAAKHKARVHQLDFIGAFLQAKVKNRVFVKLDIRYTDYFPEYAKALLFTLACKNAPMKSNWWTLDLWLAAYAKKYCKVLMEAVGDQVSPTISLFCRSPLTTILNLTCQDLHQI